MLRKLTALLLTLFLATALYGQYTRKEKKITERTVKGVVVNAEGW